MKKISIKSKINKTHEDETEHKDHFFSKLQEQTNEENQSFDNKEKILQKSQSFMEQDKGYFRPKSNKSYEKKDKKAQEKKQQGQQNFLSQKSISLQKQKSHISQESTRPSAYHKKSADDLSLSLSSHSQKSVIIIKEITFDIEAKKEEKDCALFQKFNQKEGDEALDFEKEESQSQSQV